MGFVKELFRLGQKRSELDSPAADTKSESASGREFRPESNSPADRQFSHASESAAPADVADPVRPASPKPEETHFDESVERLRTANSSNERADAARAIGMTGNRLGNVHLIAALFDDAAEVRDAATDALAQLGDPANSSSLGPPIHVPEIPFADGPAGPPVESTPLAAEPSNADPLDQIRRRLDEAVGARAELEHHDPPSVPKVFEATPETDPPFSEETALRQREEEVLQRKAAEEQKLIAAVAARIKAEEDAHRFAEEDARLRLEVNRLRLAAEEIARTRADLQVRREAAAERTRLADAARARHEAEALHLAEIEQLRLDEAALRNALAESARRRAEVEAAREVAHHEVRQLAEEREQLAATETARRAEAERLRREAEERARADHQQLQNQLENMRRVVEEVAARRVEVEAAREKAVAEVQQLADIQARIQLADEARQLAEAERLAIEADVLQKAEVERQRLEEVRSRALEEQRQLEEAERQRVTEEEYRLTRLALERQRIEAEAQQRADHERQISSQIESLRLADLQARKRIEEAEARRVTAENRYQLIADQTQRMEAEARKAEIEEERILAKLDEVRRNVAIGARSATEQESRIKEETEKLRRLEEEQRHRIEAAARDRAEVERQLQQERERLQSEHDERLRASEKFNRLLEQQHPPEETQADEWRDDPAENLRPSKRVAIAEPLTEFNLHPLITPPLANAGAAQGNGQGSVTGFANVSAAAMVPAPAAAPDEFSRIAARFDENSADIRNHAARELRASDPARVVELFNRALEEASSERRRNIGSAMAASGVAAEVIDMLGGESREETYSALCLLLTMAKTGEVMPLVQAIENHDNVYVRIAAVRLLTLNGQEEIANAAARRRLEGHI